MSNVRDWADDGAGGFVVVNGDFSTVADAAAVGQGIACRVKMIRGEYWLDGSIGVDWIGSILVKNPDPLLVRELLREAIAETPDVTSVVGVVPTISPDRSAAISYQVRTTFSTSPIAGSIGAP